MRFISQFESGISPKSAAQHRYQPLLCYLDHTHVFYHVDSPFIWEIFGAACTQEMQHNPTMLTSILGNGTNSFSFFSFLTSLLQLRKGTNTSLNQQCPNVTNIMKLCLISASFIKKKYMLPFRIPSSLSIEIFV